MGKGASRAAASAVVEARTILTILLVSLQLLYGRAPQTFTSMKENEAIVKARWPEPSPDGSSKLEKQEKLADDDAEEVSYGPRVTRG